MQTLLKLSEIEKSELETPDSSELPPPDIVAYNELRSCADLLRMYNKEILDINPDFQRKFVWKPTEQTRFIDSLTKQLPIPSMCFAVDYKLQKWIVIDGLQRISTIIRFLEAGDWVLSNLDDIDPALSGVAVKTIASSISPLNKYYSRVENLSIPITMLRCDFSKKNHNEYLFTIFHRLNTGGTKLNNQEIRNCIYTGIFNQLLKQLDENAIWLKLLKQKKGQDVRYKNQELMLRFFAYHDTYEKYTGHLSTFLNDYMYDNRNPDVDFLNQKTKLFIDTVTLTYSKLFDSTPPRLSTTVLEALLVGVSKNLQHLMAKPKDEVMALYPQLLIEDEFTETSLLEGLSRKPKVIARLNKAVEVFGR